MKKRLRKLLTNAKTISERTGRDRWCQRCGRIEFGAIGHERLCDYCLPLGLRTKEEEATADAFLSQLDLALALMDDEERQRFKERFEIALWSRDPLDATELQPSDDRVNNTDVVNP
jgi:hypothetical protein